MITIKNQRGITIITLVLTIVIMLILATVGTKTGIENIEHSRMVNFVSRMQLIQKKVDFLAENGGYENLGQILVEVQRSNVNTIANLENISLGNDDEKIKYFDSSAIAEDLGIENINDEIVVDFSTRQIVSINGIKYDGKMHYSQYSLPGGQTIIQNTTQISRQIYSEDITITPNINGLNATFTISGIRLANGTLSYSNDNKKTWIEITNYTVAGENVTTQNITKSGIYFFRWVDNTNKNNIYLLNDDGISLKLTNSPELKGDLGERSPNYNYSDLTTEEGSTNWAYATDSVTEYIYVWIPRFAYETEDTTNIEFLRGTSLVTTSDKYLPESGWTIPEPLKDVTGIWVKVTAVDADNTGIISALIDNDLSNLTIL